MDAPTAAASGDDATGTESAGGGPEVYGRPIAEPATPPTDARLPAPEQLAAVAVDVLTELDAGTLPPTPDTDCQYVDSAGAVLARHVFEGDAGSIELLIGIDRVAGTADGIDPDTCEIAVRTTLP
jgi:hypothetical protein